MMNGMLIKKGDLVRVVTGNICGGYAGKVVSLAREWNITYASVEFDGLPNPVKLNTDRLEIIKNAGSLYESRFIHHAIRKPQASWNAFIRGH